MSDEELERRRRVYTSAEFLLSDLRRHGLLKTADPFLALPVNENCLGTGFNLEKFLAEWFSVHVEEDWHNPEWAFLDHSNHTLLPRVLWHYASLEYIKEGSKDARRSREAHDRGEVLLTEQEKEIAAFREKVSTLPLTDYTRIFLDVVIHLHGPREVYCFTNDCAAVITRRSHDPGAGRGGMVYYDQLHVFCRGQQAMQEVAWRDAEYLRIWEVSGITEREQGNSLVVAVEVKNRQGNGRTMTFQFKAKTDVPQATLSAERQNEFVAQVALCSQQVLETLTQEWKQRDGTQPAHYGGDRLPPGTVLPAFVPFERPSVVSQDSRPALGLAVIVTRYQIGHMISPQIRFQAWLVRLGKEGAREILEDHAYIDQGSPDIEIQDITSKEVVLLNNGRQIRISIPS